MPRYHIINASNDVFSAPSEKGDGIVQPNTQRTLELDVDYSETRLANFASSGIFIKKTNNAAENGQPWPSMDSNIAEYRNRLMVVSGQERDDLISELRGEKTASKKSAAKSSGGSANTTPAPDAVQTSTAPTAPTSGAGNTTTMG